jgi:TATA-binding protein-associated factor
VDAAAVPTDSWPGEGLAEELCRDLFDPAWEVRHGAAMALRDLLRRQAGTVGRVAGWAARRQAAANARWLEGAAVRLMCLLALDRFGDFVSDQVRPPTPRTQARAPTCSRAAGVSARRSSMAIAQA